MIKDEKLIINYSTNVNFIKFLAAIMVILAHAFPISKGNSEGEWMMRITDGQMTFGALAVCIFFFYSGLLVTKSCIRSKENGGRYFYNRIIRIFPSLIIVVLLSILLLGVFVSECSLAEYFLSKETWLYLLNGILIPIHNLPGVFNDNPYLPTVNGSLWTLPVEFICYIILWCICALKKIWIKIIPFVTVLTYCICVLIQQNFGLEDKFGLLMSCLMAITMFCEGTLYYVYAERIKINYINILLVLALLLVFNYFHILMIAIVVTLPYILYILGFYRKRLPDVLGKCGNISYEIYLTAFPIQQLVAYYCKGSTPYENILLTIPMSILCGICVCALSGRFCGIIEKQFKQ